MSEQAVSFVPLIVEDRLCGDKKPQLAVPTDDGKPKKLKLELRRLAIEEELIKLRLPKDERELVEFAIRQRQQTLEGRYNLVFFWIKVQQRGETFWEKFKCWSANELLGRLDLPVGETLAGWEIIVRLVDQETFLLVGDEALGYMMYLVSHYQRNNPAERRKDYEMIFRGYSGKYSAFDKRSFKGFVNQYVNQKYVPASSLQGSDVTRRPVVGGRGVRKEKHATPWGVVYDNGTATVQPDFKVVDKVCIGCRDRNVVIDGLKQHVIQLEEIICQNLGPAKVPPRPKILEVAAA